VTLCAHDLRLTGVAGDPASPVHALDPRAKVLGLVGVTLIAVSAPLPAWPVYMACAAVLVAVAATARVPARTVWRRARVVVPLVVLVAGFVPFMPTDGTRWSLGAVGVSESGVILLAEVAAKAAVGTVAAVLLGATTGYPAVLAALEALRVPRTLTLVASVMYRYLFVLVDEVGRMRAAAASRGYRPRSLVAAGTVGRLVAALFLRSVARGERVHLAMLARGYDGSLPARDASRFRRPDAGFVLLVAIALLPLRIGLEVMS